MSIYITYLKQLCLSSYYDFAVSIYFTLIVELVLIVSVVFEDDDPVFYSGVYYLLQKQPKQSTPPRHNVKHQFYTRVKNLTYLSLNKEEMQLHIYCLNYSIERPISSYIANLTSETERTIRLLDVKMQNTYSIMATNKLKQIVKPKGQNNVLQKRQLHVMKVLNKKLTTENAIITQADKGKTIVIINANEYFESVNSFLNANNFNILTKDPTDKFHNLIHKILQESNLIIRKKNR